MKLETNKGVKSIETAKQNNAEDLYAKSDGLNSLKKETGQDDKGENTKKGAFGEKDASFIGEKKKIVLAEDSTINGNKSNPGKSESVSSITKKQLENVKSKKLIDAEIKEDVLEKGMQYITEKSDEGGIIIDSTIGVASKSYLYARHRRINDQKKEARQEAKLVGINSRSKKTRSSSETTSFDKKKMKREAKLEKKYQKAAYKRKKYNERGSKKLSARDVGIASISSAANEVESTTSDETVKRRIGQARKAAAMPTQIKSSVNSFERITILLKKIIMGIKAAFAAFMPILIPIIAVVVIVTIISSLLMIFDDEDKDDEAVLIPIEINGEYNGEKGNLTLKGEGILIKNIIVKGDDKKFSGKNIVDNKKDNYEKVKAEYTAYYPANNSLQGGMNDCKGHPLRDYLDNNQPVVAAPQSLEYGSKIRIMGTKSKYDGIVHTVRDTGGAIKIKDNGEYRFDILTNNHAEAYGFGRRKGYAILGDGDQQANLNGTIKKNESGKYEVEIKGDVDGVEVYTEGSLNDNKIKTEGFYGDGASLGLTGGEGVEDMVKWAEKIAKGVNKHGYSQSSRTCWLCKNGTQDYDCSSFVTAALAHNKMGEDFEKACKTWPLTTYDMGTVLQRNGWKNMGNLSPGSCKRGDILLNPSSHVEICIGKKSTVGAHNDYDGKSGESHDNEISIINNKPHFWTQVWRHFGK